MIAAMRPDIDNIDEYVRNTTARAFSVVASALGIPALLPFLKAVCQSKKSWQVRQTAIARDTLMKWCLYLHVHSQGRTCFCHPSGAQHWNLRHDAAHTHTPMVILAPHLHV